MSRTKNAPLNRWLKIIVLLLVIASIKWMVDYLSIDGNPMDALAFKIRSRVSGDSYFMTVQPTSFQLNQFEEPDQFEVDGQVFTIQIKAQSIRLTYFGDPIERAPLNRLLDTHYQELKDRLLAELKSDAQQAIQTKELALSGNPIPVRLTIMGDVAYFSKSICSVRYRVSWQYTPIPDAVRHRRGGVVLDLIRHRRMPLKDILAYPYNTSMVKLWEIIQAELEFSGKNPSLYRLYQNEPDFYLSPIGLIAINLSETPESDPVDIRIAYREYPALFRSQGNLKNLIQPTQKP